MIKYTVQPGDSLSLIAKRHGLSSYHQIYNHPSNAEFRKKRPNPNLIYPGDVISIPETTLNEAEEKPSHPIPSQGDRGVHSPASPPEQPKRQEESILVPELPSVLSDSFWVPKNPKEWPRVRKGNIAQFLIDGSSTMSAVAKDLKKAKNFIYITDWAINPWVHLIRVGKLKNSNRLINILKEAAKQGVQVRIMLWDSADKTPSGIDNHDIEAEKAFEKAHKNIRVSRNSFATYWSHHQKSVVIDGSVAFLGGIDLASGRWDTNRHPVYGNPTYFNDADFHNPCIAPKRLNKVGKPLRDRYPRMPWHDVHLRIEGPAAFDVERNFVERWNHQRKSGKNEAVLPMSKKEKDLSADMGKQAVQVIRSVDSASAGVSKTETSINNAYIRAIQRSQHFIYIENQFFTSNFGTSTVSNQVAKEIVKRIIKAIDAKETFRVIVVLPVHPEGEIEKWATQELMHWQYQTIVRSGNNSLIGQLRKKLGKRDTSDYLGFFALRGYGQVGGKFVTEQIYVHSKMMIVDDRVAIIGSANINDRSLLGNRDSELSAIVIDQETRQSKLDGNKVLVRNFAQELRLKLWQEHLGLSNKAAIEDPIIEAVYKDIWWKTAKENTKIFERVFPNIPQNAFATLKDQKKAKVMEKRKIGELSKIKGYLTVYPLDWLRNEDLETAGYPDDIFVWHHPRQPKPKVHG